MKLIIVLCSFLSIANATLSKNDIENIRKELNEELTQLENVETKKRSDNKQVASVINDDDHKTDDILRQIVDMNNKKNEDLWAIMNEKDKVKIPELDRAFGKETAKKSVDNKELENLFANIQSKKSVDKKTASLESLDALTKLLMNKEQSTTIRKREYLGRYIPPEECNDQRVDCVNFKNYCEEPAYRLMMRERCPYTCKACSKCDQEDKWKKATCDSIVRHKLCHSDVFGERIKENCYKSCGYCRASAPPACNFDPLGCCWDGKTFAKDGCNACEDSPSVGKICTRLIEECRNEHAPGIWMKKHCPVTCGMCDPKKECHDNKRFFTQCKVWAAKGDCSQESTRSLCPRTCKACPNGSVQ